MPNYIWYLIITIISLGLFVYTLLKTKNRKVIALYTFISGLTYLFEFVILVIFKSYVYLPNVMKDPYFDNIFGAIVSDAFSVPMAACFIAALKNSWKWIFITTGFLVGTEAWFVHVHAYSHFWWTLPYTAVSLVACFLISKKWYQYLHVHLTKWVQFFTLYFTNVLLHASCVFVLVSIFHSYHYEIGWFENKTRDHIAFATVYIFLLSFLFAYLVTFSIRWRWRMVILSLTIPLNWMLIKMGILHISNHWSLFHFFLLRVSILLALSAFSHYFLTSNKNNQEGGR